MITLAQFHEFLAYVNSSPQTRAKFNEYLYKVHENILTINDVFVEEIKFLEMEKVLELFKECQDRAMFSKLEAIKFINNYNGETYPIKTRYVADIPGLKEAKDLFDSYIWPNLYHAN
jgi:hypothetical protein